MTEQQKCCGTDGPTDELTALYLLDAFSDKRASSAILKQYDKMLKTPKTVAPSALTPFKNIHCDGAHHSAGRGLQGRGAGA